MGLSVTKRPDRSISGNKSYWVAAGSERIPIVFEFTTDGLDPGNIIFHQVEVYEKDTNTLLYKSLYRCKQELPLAKTTVDISAVRNFLSKDYSNPSGVNSKDHKSTLAVYLIVREQYLDTINGGFISGIGNVYNDEANTYYLTTSVKQFGEVHGQNMAEYVTIPEDDIKAKFLNKFINPRYYPGYPNFISFIYSELLAGVEIIKVERELDINKQQLNITETQLDRSQIKNINKLSLKSSYAPNVKYVEVYLKTGIAAPDQYVETGYVTEGFVI